MANEPVENFKLTGEQLAWQKTYNGMQKALGGLQLKYEAQASETRKTKQLLDVLEGQRKKLLLLAPQEPMKELEGQELSQEQMELNY